MIPRTMASTGGAVGGSEECGGSPPHSSRRVNQQHHNNCFSLFTSKGQSQHLASILHRFSSQGNTTNKYHKKNRRDCDLGKMEGFYVLMPEHINNFYSQNSFHEETEEKDSLELLLGSIKMRPYKNK